MNEAERREQYAKLIRAGNVFEDRVLRTWMEKSYDVSQQNFCQKFAYLSDRFILFRTMFWNLWRDLPKGVSIDPEIIKGELIRWLGSEKIDEAIRSSPEEYDEFLKQVQDLFDTMTQKYYSGFIGRMLRKWDNLHQGEKAKKYKKLD